MLELENYFLAAMVIWLIVVFTMIFSMVKFSFSKFRKKKLPGSDLF